MNPAQIRVHPLTYVIAGALLVAATLATFWPVLDNGFVNWGDDQEIVGNERFRGFSGPHLQWMFSVNLMGHYQPLSWLTLALDHQLWGLNPRGFHLTTLLLHAACAVAAMVLIVQLVRLAQPTANIPGTWLIAAAMIGALTFAVHPLRVEEVAWTAERRGPLSALFYVLTISFYLASISQRREWWRRRGRLTRARTVGGEGFRRVALVCFLLSLLAKEFGFLLPVVLLILDAYPLRRLRVTPRGLLNRLITLIFDKWEFFALGALWALVAVWSSAASNVAKDLSEYGILQRLAQAFFGLSFYVEKTIWPSGLSPIYSIPPKLDPFAITYWGRAAFVILITVALWTFRKRAPGALAAWAVYVVIVSPVLGLTQTGRQIAADRYTYLPAIGLAAVLAGGIVQLRNARSAGWRSGSIGQALILAIASVGYGYAAHRQTQVWRDSQTLWEHALAVNPRCPVAHNNLAVVRAEASRADEAIALFRRGIELDPKNYEAYRNLGVIFAQRNDMKAAVEAWRAAMAINSDDRITASYLERATQLSQP
ncbi:MAG: tetratricopeptide repeat protein [Phycisphaerae bacterium]|nr:tetratricopeptide repeat protein [Phycisphaerae bacterium]